MQIYVWLLLYATKGVHKIGVDLIHISGYADEGFFFTSKMRISLNSDFRWVFKRNDELFLMTLLSLF